MDDGDGFDRNVVDPGFGLRSMQERAQSLGGSLAVESSRNEGTTIRASVPVNKTEKMES
jgi:signal transduction histidine kinase